MICHCFKTDSYLVVGLGKCHVDSYRRVELLNISFAAVLKETTPKQLVYLIEIRFSDKIRQVIADLTGAETGERREFDKNLNASQNGENRT